MSVPAGAMLGPPPQGLAQLPPGPPGMGATPMGGNPVQALSATVAGIEQQQAQQDAAATSALMMLAQLLGDQASPEAVAAQTSPSPGLPTAPMAGS